jgi:hypothetical protein
MMAKQADAYYGSYRQVRRPDGKNKIKDLQNFLSISPLQVFN